MPRPACLARLTSPLALGVVLFSASAARAQSAVMDPSGPTLSPTGSAPTEAEPKKSEGAFDNPYFAVKAERRSGVVLGLSLGTGASSASGTPIKFNLRGQKADPGVSLARGQTFFVGGAFTDWFSFHFALAASTATKGNDVTSGGEFLFGVETWPLFPLGGFWRDFGVGGDFGIGSAAITKKDDPNTALATGGGDSVIRASVFWDGLRFWQMNFGPYLSFETRSTQNYSEQIYFLGGRLAFYGGPLGRGRSATWILDRDPDPRPGLLPETSKRATRARTPRATGSPHQGREHREQLTRDRPNLSRRLLRSVADQARDLDRRGSLRALRTSDRKAPRLVRPRDPSRTFGAVQTRTLRRPRRLISEMRIPKMAPPHRKQQLRRNPKRPQLVMRQLIVRHGFDPFAPPEGPNP